MPQFPTHPSLNAPSLPAWTVRHTTPAQRGSSPVTTISSSPGAVQLLRGRRREGALSPRKATTPRAPMSLLYGSGRVASFDPECHPFIEPIAANHLVGSIWQVSYIGTIISRDLGCVGSARVICTGGTAKISRYWISGTSEGGIVEMCPLSPATACRSMTARRACRTGTCGSRSTEASGRVGLPPSLAHGRGRSRVR